MKSLSAMELRKHLGAVIDDVRLKSETYILERSGKAVAMISPVHISSAENQSKQKLQMVKEMAGIYTTHARDSDLEQWLVRERAGGDRDI